MTKPQIITRAGAGLGPVTANGSYKFGKLGHPKAVTFHHSASPQAKTDIAARGLLKGFQGLHVSKGWGDIAYHFAIASNGHVFHCRPTDAKGAHTALHNSNNVGIVCIGNFDQTSVPKAMKETILWLFQGGFYQLQLIRVHEKDLLVRTHHEWPNQSTECPGNSLQSEIAHLRKTEH